MPCVKKCRYGKEGPEPAQYCLHMTEAEDEKAKKAILRKIRVAIKRR